MPILVTWPVAEVLETNLVDSSTQGLGIPDASLATPPAISVKKPILLSIHRDGHRIVLDGKGQIIPCGLTGCPFDLNLPSSSSSSKRTRHLDIKYFFITDCLSRKVVDDIVYCPTGDMTGDFPSKPLQGALFKKHRKTMMNWNQEVKFSDQV